MNNQPRSMKKYYVSMAVLLLVAFGVVVLTFVSNRDERADKITADQLSSVANAIQTNASRERKLPASLEQAEYQGKADRVTYERLSESTYMLCATYAKEAGNGSDSSADSDPASGPDFIILTTLRRNNPNTTYAYYAYNYYASASQHPKGKYCAVISDSTLQKNSSGVQLFNRLNTGKPSPDLRTQ